MLDNFDLASNRGTVVPEQIVQAKHESRKDDHKDNDKFSDVLVGDEEEEEEGTDQFDAVLTDRMSSVSEETYRHHAAEGDLQRSQMLKCRQEKADARETEDVGNGKETFGHINRIQ